MAGNGIETGMWKREKCSEFDDLHVALFIAGTSCTSIWSWRDIIAFDSPNTEHGRRRWRLTEFKMADWKPEEEISFERNEVATRFQQLPHIFDHARLRYATDDDMARRRQTWEAQNGDDTNRR